LGCSLLEQQSADDRRSAGPSEKKVRSFSDSNGFVNFFNITGQVAEIDYSNNRIRLLVSRRNPNYFLDIEMENSRIPARYKALELVTIEGTSGVFRETTTPGA
jgi:hypothetical protein